MAKRLTSERLMVEYIEAQNKRRASTVRAMVEYIETQNKRRLSALRVMVEYVPAPANEFGPRWQMMG